MWNKRIRSIIALYLLTILLITAWLGLQNMRARGDWSMADWLINYSGGFVRRGLIGQIALLFSHLHLSPFAFVLALQLAFYSILFYTVWRLLEGVRWSIWLLALIFSPATLIYHLMDPLFAFRKEELLFATLSALLLLFMRKSVSDRFLSVYLTAASLICVLSHEGLALYSLYLFGAILLHLGDRQRALRIAIAPALAILLSFAAVSRFPGDLAASQTICASIGSTLTDPPTGVCAGAIAYLAHDRNYAHSQVLRLLGLRPYLVLIARLAALALLPFILAFMRLWQHPRLRPQLKIWAVTALASFALTIPLFLYAIDWTRWIYIHVMCMFLLLLYVEWESRQSNHPQIAPDRIVPASPWKRALVLILFLGYLWGWDLAIYQPRVPYGGLAHYLYQYHQASHSSIEPN